MREMKWRIFYLDINILLFSGAGSQEGILPL